MLEAHKVENWPGEKEISGFELMKKFKGHVEKFNVEIKDGEVVDAKKEGEGFTVTTSKNEKYKAKTLLLALGLKRKKLGIPGEGKYAGKGVSRCAVCDAAFYKGKVVGVAGGSNAAANSAILLSRFAKKVYIIYRKEEIRAEPILKEEIKNNDKIEIINNAQVKEICGKDFVDSVILDSGKKLPLDGLFVEIGGMPSTVLAEGLGVRLDENKLIMVDDAQSTSVPGVFAAGDITTGSNKLMQIVTAAAEGAVAVTSAYKFLSGKK